MPLLSTAMVQLAWQSSVCGGIEHTQVEQVESLTQPLFVLEGTVCGSLGAVGRILLRIGRRVASDLRHASQLWG